MGVQITNICPGQVVPTGSAKLTFTTLNSILNAQATVPANVVVIITNLTVTNTTAGALTLKLWKGPAATDVNALVPGPVTVPPPTLATPNLQILTAPIVLMPGDAIWGLGSGAGLNAFADGQVIVQ